ncbi:helix-turn-helix domain-containing protein [Kitasatospora sp. NPDC052896]|uniref:helix-turn-helix domain-containing protein n=1 Tax=Kitasatospora sp. NPDC052896 TaxID=3364061 RepID=UPI0037CC80D8
MGRRESAVAADTRQLEALALWLREQRRRAQLTYAAMATITSYSTSMLSRAAGGRTVPSWRIVEEFTKACRGDLAEAKQRWRKARWAEQKRRRARGGDLAQAVGDLYSHRLVHPEIIETFAQLSRAMIELRAKYGQLSDTELQRLAGLTPDGEHRLPRSSLGAILRGEILPLRRHVTAFTEALGLPPRVVTQWEEAWERARASKLRPPAPRAPHRAPETNTPGRPPVRIRINIPAEPAPGGSIPGGRIPGGRIPGQSFPGGPDSAATARTMPLSPGLAWGESLLQDVSFLRTHGLPVDVKHARPIWPGPQEPYPPAGLTTAGLPIRVPRRYDYFRPPTPGEQAQPRLAARYWPTDFFGPPQPIPVTPTPRSQ